MQLLKYWNRLRASFWFLPAVMALLTIALAFATIALDKSVTEWLRNQSWAYTGGAQGASAMLGTIAGSMITIAGVVFSLTLVALSLASSQFGPRLLRNFMRDTATQVVLGTFISTFLYCLLIMRTIRRPEEGAFVPHLSITLGVGFAIASLGVLIYFIHHVSVSIQADHIVSRVGAELLAGIDRLFPKQIGHAGAAGPSGALPANFERDAAAIGSTADGYLQLIDGDELLSLAVQEDVLLSIQRRPGDYVVADYPLVRVWPPERMNKDLASRVNSAFVLGNQRTPEQDLCFLVDQLVEIALRALSPGVNDPFTAIVCVDRLGSGPCRLTQRDVPSPCRVDEKGHLRVVALARTFPEIVSVAFDQIRQQSRSQAAVAIHLLDIIAMIARTAHRPLDRAALRQQADMILRGAERALPEAHDRKVMQEHYHATAALLQ